MTEALKKRLLVAHRGRRIGIPVPDKLGKKPIQPILSVRLLLLLW